MTTYEVEIQLAEDKTLILKELPFAAGTTLEVSVRGQEPASIEEDEKELYPLWGTPYRYDDPFGPAVPLEDWGDLG